MSSKKKEHSIFVQFIFLLIVFSSFSFPNLAIYCEDTGSLDIDSLVSDLEGSSLGECADECTGIFCSESLLCFSSEMNPAGSAIPADALPFVPALYETDFKNFITYSGYIVPDRIVDAHNPDLFDLYYSSLSREEYYDSQCIYEAERKYFLSNGNRWFVCGPETGSLGSLGEISVIPGESAMPNINGPGSAIDIVELNISELNDVGQMPGESSGIDYGDSASLAIVNIVDDNFFDGIYYGDDSAILVNQPQYGDILDITTTQGQTTHLCIEDGECIDGCALDPDCCQLDLDCLTGNACNPELNGYCDPDCGRGVDPDCTFNAAGDYWRQYLSTTFSCGKSDFDYMWYQCCPDPNNCQQFDKGDVGLQSYTPIDPFIPGDRMTTIKEFPCISADSSFDRSKNCALLFGFNEDSATDPVFPLYTTETSFFYQKGIKQYMDATVSRLNLSDWSDYDYLEFYIAYFANFELNISIKGLVPGIVRGKWDTPNNVGEEVNPDVVLFGPEKVVNYAVQPPALKKWLHIKIPLGNEYSNLRQAKILRIEFSASREVLDQIDSQVTYVPKPSALTNVGANKFQNLRNILAIDKIFLTKESGDNMICSGAYPTETYAKSWIKATEFDDPTLDNANVPIGQVACVNTPGYGWTGSQCCGDDQDKDYPSGLITYESYIDDGSNGVHACLFGNILKNNTVMEIHVP